MIAAVVAGLVLPLAVVAPSQAADDVSLEALEVERKPEPVGIDVDAPRFSWIIDASVRDVTQESYRVRVAESADALEAGDVVWDGGTVPSSSTFDVEYDGPQLEAATHYTWDVASETTAGMATATSHFTTGLFVDEDWADSAWIGNERPDASDQLTLSGASWIWTPEQNAPFAPAEARAFRLTHDSDGRVARNATVLITADDAFELWVNGTSLGSTQGAENEWQQSHLYTSALQPDGNVFAVRTVNGGNTPAGLIAKVRIAYADGTSETFVTDDDWLASKTVEPGFESPDFDDSGWGHAAVFATYGSGPWGSGVRPPAERVLPAPLLRKEFEVDADLARATLYYAAGAYADVTLNGEPISDAVLTPGFTDYDDTVQYAAADVTGLLAAGVNAAGIELGRGFFGMTGGNVWRWESPPWHDEPMVRAVLHLEYADGRVDEVVTDDSWTIADGPTVFDDLYAGERYDARLAKDGFDAVGYDDDTWTSANEVEGPSGVLVNMRQQPIRVTESLPAEEITEPADGVYVVKFPRVIAGWTQVTAEGAAGATVQLRYAEKLADDGTVNQANNGGFAAGFQTDRFTLAGTGAPETWEARFSYKGFQYVEVTGWPGDEAPPLSAFTAKVVHTDAEETGSFESANPLLDQTHRAVVDTMLNNIHSIPTDTPMFEKNGWTGDAAIGAEMFMLNLDVHELFAKWIRDVHETRDEGGAPLVIAPSSGDWGQWGVNPPWHSAYVMIPWWLYQYGGDERVLSEYYDGMKGYVDLEFGRSAAGIVSNPRLGDWVSPEASPAGGNAPEDTRVSATAYLYTMLRTMERAANLLGEDADATAFADDAAVVKEAFNAAFLADDGSHYRGNGDRGYRQTHNVLALAFGLTPDEETAERVAASIVADIEAKGMHLNTGVLGTKYLLPVLTDYGYADVAYAVATQTTYPSWGYMIENGATTMWEHWALDARSRGHYFLGTIDDWLFHDVAGIQASEETGYRDITIAPAVTTQLDHASASTSTPYGPVSSSWRRDGDRLQLDVHVPVGSTATVVIPAANAYAVTEGGVRAADAEGVHDVSAEDGLVRVVIGSGDYAFASDPRLGMIGSVIELVSALPDLIRSLEADGLLNGGLSGRLARFAERAADAASEAFDAALPGETTAAAQHLAAAEVALDELATALKKDDADAAVELVDAVSDASDAAGAAVASLLGLALDATVGADVLRPGDVASVLVGVANQGDQRIGNVRSVIAGLDDDWTVDPVQARLANQLDAGQSAQAEFALAVPQRQKPGTTTASARVTFDYAGASLSIRAAFELTVDSPVLIDSVTADPAEVRPGGRTDVTVAVRNVGSVGSDGVVVLELPEGWEPVGEQAMSVPAGGTQTATFAVAVPRDAAQAVTDVGLVARFISDGEPLASGSGPLRVAIDAIVDDAIDHVDLGDGTSEQVHALSASPSSGTSDEAGLTRRYAGHLTPFSYFEFDVAVPAGESFVLRATETYDRDQVKRYKVYVDGEEVLLRTFAHGGGAGTETYEFVVPAAHADEDGVVRVKFENQDDPSYYDPSIADVWVRPAG
ncbi:family 78 glycoside hydrolase catalytic domain [Agromyces sp. Soil535]|uniref:family 78 glycoside hydrolase catalytic domain n=1 Tax=Agromyces sp. Soil535 TaxID=1736390 RepID=UPI0006F8FB07|nr:family 78 glycoside hydrolase catalytic domain [Agromyces sp. Soil535]KRE30484.1 hypothetical protein ASG80_17200 [Agromyces sp. Soil535]